MFLFFLIFYLLCGSEAQFSYYEGDLCKINNVNGTCKLLENCSVVYEEFRAGKRPEVLCGFIGRQVVVCCPENAATEFTTTTTSTSEDPRIKQLDELSRKKCEEYAAMCDQSTMNQTEISSRMLNFTTGVLYVSGGEIAKARKHRHMAAIGFDTDEGLKWLCGGTLISDRFILTAAHCLFSSAWGPPTSVRLGDLNLRSNEDDANPQDFKILRRIKHPDYKLPRLYHDIGLIEINGTLEFDYWIKPACLPTSDTVQDGSGIATGWGKVTWTDENGSDDLLEVNLKIIPNDKCNEFYVHDMMLRLNQGVVSNWQICAGDRGKDTCQGDSGGPLIVINGRHDCLYDVIGITSVGRLCGSSVPAIYTRVSHYIEWIQNIIWPQTLTE